MQTPQTPSPAPKSQPAARLQPAGRTPARNPHHVPKATGLLPHHSQLQISPTPPAANPRASSWTQSPSQNPGAYPIPGQVKEKARLQGASPQPRAGYLHWQLGWWLQPTPKQPVEVWQGSCSSCHPSSTPCNHIPQEKEEGSPPGPGRCPAVHSPAGEK